VNAVASGLGWPSYQQSTVDRWRGRSHVQQQDYVAEEVPIALVYNRVPHVVMLATPLDLEDFAIGFSLTEGIVRSSDEILSIRTFNHVEGIEVRIRIPEESFAGLGEKGRNLTGRTGCGLCGASSLKHAVRRPEPVCCELRVDVEELHSALRGIKEFQTLNELTGAVHAAAWALPEVGIQKLREDVGRHNALDKLIGALVRSRADPGEGFVVVTSRASYEMVQKCATAGIALIAAISAPTGLAIRLAHDAGVTLIGFARNGDHVVYTHPHRLVEAALA
jgi:formate dehydrogenase accessory protein FdhD